LTIFQGEKVTSDAVKKNDGRNFNETTVGFVMMSAGG